MCFVELALNHNNSVDSVILFYIISSFTHSSLVLNLNDFLSSAEHKCYFEEDGKTNSCWSSVTSIGFFSFYQSQCGPATVWFSTFFKIPYFVNQRRKLKAVSHRKHLLTGAASAITHQLSLKGLLNHNPLH